MDDYEMEESIDSELVDRLSELPLCLIHYILSFLPIWDVASTSILSKSWKNLWTTVPYLNLCVEYMDYIDCDFIDRVLMLWKGTKILKYEIDVPNFCTSSTDDMNPWVRFAVDNKVEELNIDLVYDIQETWWFDRETSMVRYEEEVYSVPQCLYSCSSIRKLRLVGCNLGYHGSPSWNQLESLNIDGYFFSESLINCILSGSPRLEVFELRFFENYEYLNITSTSLKRLKIKKDSYGDDPSRRTALRICCPNLETLEISGALFSKCVFTDVSSLTDATIGFYDSPLYGTWLADMLRQILSTMQHVEKLTLSYWCVQVSSESKNLVSPLQNVKFLKLDACSIKLGDMMDLLWIFPNLKVLVIGYLVIPKPPNNYMKFEANLPKSFMLQLKTVEITSSLVDSSQLWFFELLLKRATMLEKLVIRVKDIESHQHELLCEVGVKLQSMPRSSPIAKVILNTT